MAEGGFESFDEWLLSIGGLTEAGRQKLEKATVVSVLSVRHLTQEDIGEIRLGVGDRGILRAAWQDLQTPVVKAKGPVDSPEQPIPERQHIPERPEDSEQKLYSIKDISRFFGAVGPHGVGIQQPSSDGRLEALAAARGIQGGSGPPIGSGGPPIGADVTSGVLAKDRLLNRLAAEYVSGSTGGIRDTLSLQDLNLIGFKGEKILLPVNFATVFNGCAFDEEEVVGCGQFAGRLVWQSGKGNAKRPTPDKLSFGQFFEGSARILNLLVLTDAQKVEYLDYLRQVGILLQTFTASSVFCLDHLHRHYVFESPAAKWNVIENTLQNSVLKKKEDFKHGNVSGRKNDNAMRFSDGGGSSSGKESYADKVCWLYNLHKGCPLGADKCKYPHVCSVDHCRGSHPAYKHAESTMGPRFGNSAAKQSA
jgi:hypothetical protein